MIEFCGRRYLLSPSSYCVPGCPSVGLRLKRSLAGGVAIFSQICAERVEEESHIVSVVAFGRVLHCFGGLSIPSEPDLNLCARLRADRLAAKAFAPRRMRNIFHRLVPSELRRKHMNI